MTIGGGFSRSKSKSDIQRDFFPGALGMNLETNEVLPGFDPTREAIGRAQGLASQRSNVTTDPNAFANLRFALPASFTPEDKIKAAGESAFQQPLQEALLNPQFGPNTAAEQALLGDIQSQIQGASALSGTGPAGGATLAQVLAPALTNLRQQNIANLQSSLGQDVARILGERGQDIGQRGQDISAELTGRGQDISAGLTEREQDIGFFGQQQRQGFRENQAEIDFLNQLAPRLAPQLLQTGTTGRQSGFNVGGKADFSELLARILKGF